MTDPDRWPRVKEIFHSALAVSADDRAAFVGRVSRRHGASSKRLSRSLWRMPRPEGFAESPAIAALDSAGRHANSVVAQRWRRDSNSGLT